MESGNLHNIKGLLYPERIYYRKLGWIRCLSIFSSLFIKTIKGNKGVVVVRKEDLLSSY